LYVVENITLFQRTDLVQISTLI